jgi:hypothetical protein
MQNEIIEGVLVEELQAPRDEPVDQTRLRDELAMGLALSFQVRRELRLSYENGLREGYRRAGIAFAVLAGVAALLAAVVLATVHL